MANEKRLIDANELLAMGHKTKLIEVFPEWKELPLSAQKAVCKYGSFLKKMIQHLPTVDAVEVVRCKDCKFGKEAEWYRAKLRCTHPSCMVSQVPYEVPPSHFCSYGERRTDDRETG